MAVCVGSTASVEVSASGNVSHYEWRTTEGLIKGVTGSQLTTGPVNEELIYIVNAVTPAGCAGPQTIVTVMPDHLPEPEIIPVGDTLFTSVAAAEYTWFLNGEELVKSESAYYLVADQDGEYMLQVRSGDCQMTSRAFGVTSISPENNGSSIHLFPNPTTSANINLKGQLSSGTEVRIRILDNIGREVYATTAAAEEVAASVRLKVSKTLSPGIYFLVLEQDSRKEKIKFILRE